MTSITEKRCWKCKETKNIFEFGKNKTTKDGFQAFCKECGKEIQKKTNERPERKEALHQYRMDHKEKIYKYCLEWNAKNKEYLSEYRKKKYALCPEKQRGRTKKWEERNPEKSKECRKNWASNNVEKLKKSRKNWEANNPEAMKIKNIIRRTRKVDNGGHITAKEWNELLFEADYKCQKCGNKNDLTFDHIIPVLLGGRSEKENAQVLCRSCNSSKGTKIIDYRKMSQAALGVKNE